MKNERKTNLSKPLILVTNDDGIESDGLWASVEALLPLGEVLVVAPDRQWSGAGRSMPYHVTGRVSTTQIERGGQMVTAHAVDGSPALAVQHALLELAPRPIALVVSGINYGVNLGTEVTVSGTIGAALEAAAFGIPALAVSLEMDPACHLTGDKTADYAAAQAFTREFAQRLLSDALPDDVHALSLNIPGDATTATPWRVTHLSQCRYYWPTAPDRKNGSGRPGYRPLAHSADCEGSSDIYAVDVDRVVSVTPLSLNLTSRVGLSTLETCLRGDSCARSGLFWPRMPPIEEWRPEPAIGGWGSLDQSPLQPNTTVPEAHLSPSIYPRPASGSEK